MSEHMTFKMRKAQTCHESLCFFTGEVALFLLASYMKQRVFKNAHVMLILKTQLQGVCYSTHLRMKQCLRLLGNLHTAVTRR